MRFLTVLGLLLTASSGRAEVVNTQVVIIGGGPAGLGAAKTLHDAGIEFVLVEAMSTLGGRVRAFDFAGQTLSMGAAWIHGQTKASGGQNPIYTLAQSAQVPYAVTDYEDTTVYKLGGANFGYQHADIDTWWRRAANSSTYCTNKGDQLWAQAEADDLDVWESIDITVQHCWEESGYYMATDGSAGNVSGDERKLAEAILWVETDFELIPRPTQVGVMWSYPVNSDYIDRDLYIKGNYTSIITSVVSGFPSGSIRTSHKVTSVTYSASGVTVMTDAGLEVHAHYGICTLPSGILKQGSVTFNPAFSSARLAGIAGIGFVGYEKAWLQFPSTFWNDTEVSLTTGDTNGNPFKTKLWLNLHNTKYYSGSRLMEIHFAGEDAAHIVSLSPADAVAHIMTELRQVFEPQVTIPDPTTYAFTNWTNDEYTMGSFTYFPFGYTEDMWTAMKNPADRLYFAGEHTSDNYGFVHAAWETGVDTASTIAPLITTTTTTTITYNTTTSTTMITTTVDVATSASFRSLVSGLCVAAAVTSSLVANFLA